MSDKTYWETVTELSRKSGECHQALWVYLQANPMPIGDALTEYTRLRDEYADAFTKWIDFSEAHAIS